VAGLTARLTAAGFTQAQLSAAGFSAAELTAAAGLGSNAATRTPPVAALARVLPTVLQAERRRWLEELANGPYFTLASFIDQGTLCSVDAACRSLNALNGANIGPWRSLGAKKFHGIELDEAGLFERQVGSLQHGQIRPGQVDWKKRMSRFLSETTTFSPPFDCREITSVDQPDEIAYFRSRLCTDILDSRPDTDAAPALGRYVEVEVVENPNNLSMAVVDFEEGGCSSVTFSPDTGAVIRESKVQESPRKVEGAYIQTLPVVPAGRPFHGHMGMYLCAGRLAFFRRCAAPPRSLEAGSLPNAEDAEESVLGPWETTGFVSDLSWAEGTRLTPCLAFRDHGAYHVRIVSVGTEPPFQPERPKNLGAMDARWSRFDWEGGDADADAADALEVDDFEQ
jgi:hypothetical protein